MSKCKYGYDLSEGTYIIRTGLYGTYTAALIDRLMHEASKIADAHQEPAKYLSSATAFRRYVFDTDMVHADVNGEIILHISKNIGFMNQTSDKIQKLQKAYPKEKLVKLTEVFLLGRLNAQEQNEIIKVLKRPHKVHLAILNPILDKVIKFPKEKYFRSFPFIMFGMGDREKHIQELDKLTVREILCAILLLENVQPSTVASIVGKETFEKIQGIPYDPFTVERIKMDYQGRAYLFGEPITYPFIPSFLSGELS